MPEPNEFTDFPADYDDAAELIRASAPVDQTPDDELLRENERIKDPAKERRMYVLRKALAWIYLLGGIAFYSALLIDLLTIAWRLCALYDIGSACWLVEAAIVTLYGAFFVGATRHAVGLVGMVNSLPHGAPAQARVAALAAEAVLVRASDQPIASNAELVRPSMSAEQAMPEELLRADPAAQERPQGE